MRITVVTFLAVVVAVAAGCGAVGHVTRAATRTSASSSSCRSAAACHTLANAGTIGHDRAEPRRRLPALDKQQGFHLSTITDVVRGQIAYPDTNPGTGYPGMTPNLLHGTACEGRRRLRRALRRRAEVRRQERERPPRAAPARGV